MLPTKSQHRFSWTQKTDSNSAISFLSSDLLQGTQKLPEKEGMRTLVVCFCFMKWVLLQLLSDKSLAGVLSCDHLRTPWI